MRCDHEIPRYTYILIGSYVGRLLVRRYTRVESRRYRTRMILPRFTLLVDKQRNRNRRATIDMTSTCDRSLIIAAKAGLGAEGVGGFC